MKNQFKLFNVQNWIKQLFKRWFEYMLSLLNNKKIKMKIIYVYILCVMVPTVVTNVIVLGSSMKLSRDEQTNNINNIADSVSHDIVKSLENAVYVTVDLYTSDSISNFLDLNYESDSEFYQRYRAVFDNYVFYASSKLLISDITFFSDNPTMNNGGKYYRIDSIKENDWYKSFEQSGKDLYIYPYYYDPDFDFNSKRMISVIRRLNYFGNKDREKLVKLDLNYNQISEAIGSAAFDTTVYVCHNDQVIFTNDKQDRGLKSEFDRTLILEDKVIQASRKFIAYGSEWEVYVTGYKSNSIVDLKRSLWIMSVLMLAGAVIPAIMLALFSNSITKRILLLGRFLEKVRGESFELITVKEGKDEIGELLGNYNHMTLRMKSLIENELKSQLEQQELTVARQQAELLALYSQINPHFLFNVLESIRMHSILKGESETSRMIESLAKLMRKSADWGADYITLGQEISFMKDYLELQKYRYGNAFHYKIKIEEQYHAYMIPSLVLVTFVENACVHGLNRVGNCGTVFVSAYERDEYFYLEIEDTGIGMEEEQVKRLEFELNEARISHLQKASGLGMLNACVRLKKFCGEGMELKIESELEEGTCIIIKIPIEDMQRDTLAT